MEIYSLYREFAENTLGPESVYALFNKLLPSSPQNVLTMIGHSVPSLSLSYRAVQNDMLKYKHVVLFRDKLDGSLRGTLWIGVDQRSLGDMKYNFIKASIVASCTGGIKLGSSSQLYMHSRKMFFLRHGWHGCMTGYLLQRSSMFYSKFSCSMSCHVCCHCVSTRLSCCLVLFN